MGFQGGQEPFVMLSVQNVLLIKVQHAASCQAACTVPFGLSLVLGTVMEYSTHLGLVDSGHWGENIQTQKPFPVLCLLEGFRGQVGKG